ncbi:MAG TPA: GNAT family protein [Caulifigura sp.]|nr:GNAT family protein [Caulifigura sp.]
MDTAPDSRWTTGLPTLTAPRIVLRAFADADLPAMFDIYSDPETMAYFSITPIREMNQAAGILVHARQSFASRQVFPWAVADRWSGNLIGSCALLRPDWTNGRAEIGFVLNRSQWGRGLATEAVGRMLAHVFDEWNLRRLEADVDPRNARCRKLLERFGFREEGLLRERWSVGGGVQDTVFYGLLRREWIRNQG